MTSESVGRRITWQEAIAISSQIMENAEKERRQYAEDEARRMAYWEDDEPDEKELNDGNSRTHSGKLRTVL